jgi:N-acetylated-alpha-linked acidic dipeptidase
VIFAPDASNGLESAVYPFIRDAIEKKDWEEVGRAIKLTAEVLNRAGDAL